MVALTPWSTSEVLVLILSSSRFKAFNQMKDSFIRQFRYCFWNNARIQSRRRLATLSVVLSPCLAVFLLLLTQDSVSKHISRKGNFKCGCECLECCEISGDSEYVCFNSTVSRPCSAYSKCIRFDENNCGYLYSTVDQVPFCEVRQPPLWPAVLQVPENEPGEHGIFLYTGSEYSTSKSVMDQLLVPEEYVSSKVAESYVKSIVLEELESYADNEDEDHFSSEMEFIDATGALTRGLYDFGIVLGTSAESSGTLLIEAAFVPQIGGVPRNIYMLLRNGMEKDGLDANIVKQIGESISNLTGITVSNLYIDNSFFDSAEEINSVIYDAWQSMGNEILGAFDWHSSSENHLELDIWVNDTRIHKVMDVPNMQRWSQAINLGINAYLSRFFGGSVVLAGVKDMPRRQKSDLQVDLSTLFGPLLTMWVMHVILPIQLYFIIYEKESGLRIFQYLNGVRPSSHFHAIFMWHLLLYMLCMTLLVGLGSAFGIKMFVLNSYWIQAVFFLLWGVVVTSFGFLYATFFKDKRSVALSSIFYILTTGFLANVFQVLLIEQNLNALVIALQSIFPSFCAFRGLYELAAYAFLADQSGSEIGLGWNTSKNDTSMLIVLIQLACQSVAIPTLAVYLDRVTGSFDGRRRNLFFFMRKEVLGGKQAKHRECSTPVSVEEDELDHYLGFFNGGLQFKDNVSRRNSSLDHYLGNLASSTKIDSKLEYESKIKLSSGGLDRNSCEHFSVVFQGVKKVFKGDTGDGIHIPCLTIQNDEIFAFIGASGSYKSTILKMMQGLVHQDAGTILIQGNDSRDIFPGKSRIGVVFDIDVLWPDLSGMENLDFFARVKLGHLVQNTRKYVDSVIEVLDLHSNINKRVSKYSMGTRRRLCLAISLLGYPDIHLLPSVIFMDEPSISMDPYSRKILWRTLREVREKTAIVISTSSITEAECCDRICIMKNGHPMYIGSPQHLIFKYGRCMWLSFTTKAKERNQVIRFVRANFTDAELLHDLGQKLKFSIPLLSDQTIDSVFRKVEKARIDTLDVLDWSISNSTLEDVYLRLVE